MSGGDETIIKSFNVNGYRGSDIGAANAIKQTFIFRDPRATDALGKRPLHVDVRVEVYDRAYYGKTIGTWTQSFVVTWEAVPRDTERAACLSEV